MVANEPVMEVPPQEIISIASGEKRVEEAIKKVQEERKKAHEDIFPVVGMLVNSGSIKDRQIDFISQKGNLLVVTFRLTPRTLEGVQSYITSSIGSKRVREGPYIFRNVQGQEITISRAQIIQIDRTTTIRLFTDQGLKNGSMSTLRGAVTIEVRKLFNARDIAQKVKMAFMKLGISDALEPLDNQTTYAIDRFRQQHRLVNTRDWLLFQEEYKKRYGVEPAKRLKYKEIIPGYFTVIDPGASEVYQREGSLFLIHTSDGTGIVSILKYGLLSRYERYKRGIVLGSTGDVAEDFYSGGADSVFLGCFPNMKTLRQVLHWATYAFIINPKILDRTDWYAYNQAEFGSTEGAIFAARPSPERFFKSLRENPILSNEVMMKRGISPEMLENLIVYDKDIIIRIIKTLQKQGITEVHGKPLEEFICTEEEFLSAHK